MNSFGSNFRPDIAPCFCYGHFMAFVEENQKFSQEIGCGKVKLQC